MIQIVMTVLAVFTPVVLVGSIVILLWGVR